MLKKIIVDILMFICMILEFSKWYMPPIYHEIIWIILLILVILHLRLNREYLKNLTKWKYNLSRWIMVIVNISFFISFFLTTIFGILSSQDLLTFANIHSLKLVELHKIFGYISLVLMAFHLWINISWWMMKLEKKINNQIVFYTAKLILVWYWIYAFVKLDIWNHLIWRYWFSALDWNIAINILNYLAVIIMITLIVNEIYMLVIKRK